MVLPETQRLLKANAVRELGLRVAFNFSDFQQQGDAYLDEVRRQAQALVQAAQQEADAIRQTAYREAHDQGRRDGLKDAARHVEEQANRMAERQITERLATTLPALDAVAQALRLEMVQWLSRWEGIAVRIAAAIAEKIVHHQVAVRPDIALDMVREALRLAAGHPQLTIHLHPDDIAHLGDHAEDVVRTMTACAQAVIVPDASAGRGGCRIETRHGEIDARVDTMLNRIVEELLA